MPFDGTKFNFPWMGSLDLGSFDDNTGHKKKFFEIDEKKVTPSIGTEKVPLFTTLLSIISSRNGFQKTWAAVEGNGQLIFVTVLAIRMMKFIARFRLWH